MRAGGRLTLGLAMLVLAVATPLACGEPFVVGAGSGGSGGKDGGTKPDAGTGGGGGGEKPSCTAPIESQRYGDCQVNNCVDGQKVVAVDVTDVYDDGNLCTQYTCDANGMLQSQPSPARKECAATGPGKLCDGKGGCVQCLGNADCTPLPTCDEGKCVPTTCTDKSKNLLETDIDCGGKDCKPCAETKSCSENGDCATSSCSGTPGNKKCQAPTCGDSAQNGNETATDCGGKECVAINLRCADGKKCREANDCVSRVCMIGVCQAPSCKDGVKNGDETDIDCGSADGGSCLECNK